MVTMRLDTVRARQSQGKELTMKMSPETPSAGPVGHRGFARRRGLLGLLFVAFAVLGVAAVLQAHGPGFGGRPMGPMGPMGMLGGHGPHGGPGGFGGREMDPEMMSDRIDFGVRWVLERIDATDEQKKQISAIFQQAAEDLKAIHEDQMEQREAMREAMVTLDKAKVETLRQASITRADQASKRITDAFLDAGALLSAEQRQELADEMDRRHGGERGFRFRGRH
jgi:Spy/CpxP family protein refolding chaperone